MLAINASHFEAGELFFVLISEAVKRSQHELIPRRSRKNRKATRICGRTTGFDRLTTDRQMIEIFVFNRVFEHKELGKG